MTTYIPPVRDMQFVLRDLVGLDALAALPGYEEASSELIDSVLEEASRIAEEVLAPINQPGDRQGAKLTETGVKTADGWKQAYQTLVDGNWIGLSAPAEFGGMGLPAVVGAAVAETQQAANMAFALCPMLTQGAINAIETAGSQEQKEKYLPNMITGVWSGAMDLTEASAGSDLAAVRTKAVPEGDAYRIFGQKIFITYGDQDLTENIIHLVLGRTPDAPPGVKGISLFIVPKVLVNDDGSLGERNDVHCISIEHKLGIHASPTCVMSFGDHGGALGYLVGEENRGLEYMFIMMNHARLNVGLQGLGIAERAYQQARNYANERIQGKAVGQTSVTPIVDHPDVRRMLMTMKAEVEAIRAVAYVGAAALDYAHLEPDATKRALAKSTAEFLTPIIKGHSTERGVDIASLGVQVHGGMGYVEETGACQHLRDARITPIYEGTTAIQANDLIGRKILRDGGETAKRLLGEAHAVAGEASASENPILRDIGLELAAGIGAAEAAVDWLVAAAKQDPRLPGASSVPMLYLFGTVLGGHQMARAALIAASRLDSGEPFYNAKLKTAWHYALHVLPRAGSYRDTIIKGSRTVMSLEPGDL